MIVYSVLDSDLGSITSDLIRAVVVTIARIGMNNVVGSNVVVVIAAKLRSGLPVDVVATTTVTGNCIKYPITT
jgi:hypothetical protein